MAQRLDRVRVKLARAETHLDAIRQAVETITARGPELIPGEFDTREHRFVFLAQHDSARGDWLGPMIGDCVHNFRAALDYLLWELSSPTYRSTHGTRIEFPIFADPEWHRSASAKAKVGGLDHAAQRIVESLQPFNGPGCRQRFDLAHPTDEPLWHLLELDNWDKHR